MARGRAFRRFQMALKKRRARDYYGGQGSGIFFLGGFRKPTPHILGMRANTPKACSCYGCGNPRRHFNEDTLQERRAAITDEDE